MSSSTSRSHASSPLEEDFLDLDLTGHGTPPVSCSRSDSSSLPSFQHTAVVQALIKELTLRLQGRFTTQPGTEEGWDVRPLQRSDYALLLSAVETDPDLSDFMYHQLRFDYDSYRQQIIFRMPQSLNHETFSCHFQYEILKQISEFQKSNVSSIASYSQCVSGTASTSISFPADISEQTPGVSHPYVSEGDLFDKLPVSLKHHRSPDQSYRFQKARYPGVIVEVSYSSKKKNISMLASEYITESYGNVRLFIGLMLDYNRSAEASFCCWRPHFDRQKNELSAQAVVENQLFRSKNRELVGSSGITVFLADFGPSPLADQYNLPTDGSASFVITPSLLLNWLSQSEEIQADSPTTDLFVPLPPGMRIHRRAATPDEVLSSPESSPENL